MDTPISSTPRAAVAFVDETPLSFAHWTDNFGAEAQPKAANGSTDVAAESLVTRVFSTVPSSRLEDSESGISELQTTDLFQAPVGPFGGIQTLAAEATERENSIRLELLARKYAQKDLPKEQLARLKIATERVRSLLPSVTPEDYDAVAALIHAAQDAQSVNASVRKNLGI